MTGIVPEALERDLSRLDAGSVVRAELVRPAMCGHNSLFAGRIGDWTWDAVSAVCDTDVLNARDPSGAPTYLSFYYYRIRGGQRFHLRTPSFGDRLRIISSVFDFGSESVLTLHRIDRTPSGRRYAEPDPARPIDPDEFYLFPRDGSLYVENFNRWVTRSDAKSNQDLVRSSPAGFRHAHLPALPAAYTPRNACHRARTRLTFVDEDAGRHERTGEQLRAEYTVDPSRDLNGVGLLYFASYFSIVDWALLRLWRELGRDDASFLDRVVADQQLCYLGNADSGSVLSVSVRRWRVRGDDTREVVDVVLRERGRVVAVCTLDLLPSTRL